MTTRVAAAMLVLVTLAALVLVAGCSKSVTSPDSLHLALGGPEGGSGDTVPNPGPPPPQPSIQPVRFLGSDSTLAGTTGELRWQIGNASGAPFVVSWTLGCELAWPGFPRNGTISVPADSAVPLHIPVAVPADARDGMVAFRMEVTRADSATIAAATGGMRVYSNTPPPPPPPPPVQPLLYLGADSVQAGGIVTQHWQLTNESTGPFTMQWTLTARPGWTDFPKTGSVTLTGQEVRELITTGAVPDTVGSGPRLTQLTITRPNGQPDASTNGWFYVRP